jgi:hypothetical protein
VPDSQIRCAFARGLPTTFGCKDMNEHLISDLHRFVDGRHVTMSETPGHVSVRIVRSGFSLSVLIPRAVLEWWVEVNDKSSGKKIEDWCDYSGYDETPERELSENMRAEVVRFIENALSRPLRVTENGRTLEWHVGKGWVQAVPLATDAEQCAAGDVRNARA